MDQILEYLVDHLLLVGINPVQKSNPMLFFLTKETHFKLPNNTNIHYTGKGII